MYTCASCTVRACYQAKPEIMPKNCPIRNETLMRESLDLYHLPKFHDFYVNSCVIEAEGYNQWPRVLEIIRFCQKMKYTKIGLAFCIGLSVEARRLVSILKQHKLEVVSVVCKVGGVAKEDAGISKKDKLRPDAFEPMCNPIAQAKFLNEQKTQMNILLGLCVGHDSLFYKHSDALVTTLVAKDRVLAHNPVGALYCSEYFDEKLEMT